MGRSAPNLTDLSECVSRVTGRGKGFRVAFVLHSCCTKLDRDGPKRIAVAAMNDTLLTMRDLCARFDVSRYTIHRWIKVSGFPHGEAIAGLKGLRWQAEAVSGWAHKLNVNRVERAC